MLRRILLAVFLLSTLQLAAAEAQSAEKLVSRELLGMSVSELEEAVQVCSLALE